MIRVLIVDDDALALEVHNAYVDRLEGFQVVGLASGVREALVAVSDPDRAIDLVLLDMTMPDGHGLDVARRIHAVTSTIDIIAITAVRDADVVRAAVSAGIVQYLIKPFAFRAFRERLEAYRDYSERLLSAAGPTTQAEVDALLGTLRTHTAELPKGLTEATLRAVSEALRAGSAALSATEIADGQGMSRVTARRYLEHLAEAGRAAREPRYGTPGRPEIAYRWITEA